MIGKKFYTVTVKLSHDFANPLLLEIRIWYRVIPIAKKFFFIIFFTYFFQYVRGARKPLMHIDTIFSNFFSRKRKKFELFQLLNIRF